MTKAPRGMNEASREYKLEDTALQIRKIGNSVGVILPKELLARLNLKEGDKFYPVEQPDGSLRLSPFDPKHAADHGNRPQGHARISRYVCSACKMSEPIWLDVDEVIDMHAEQLAIFGGPEGIRDRGLLESAVLRPVNQWNYGQADMAALAAAYAFGLARNHAFVDGNKRIAFHAMMVFLRVNDIPFAPDPAHATAIILSLAAGEVSEESLTRWIRDNWPAE